MTIEERLLRRDTEDLIYIGELVEKMLLQETGSILKALTNGRISHEAETSAKSGLSAERHLGRIEAYQQVMNDLETFVTDMKKLKEPIEVKEEQVPQLGAQPI